MKLKISFISAIAALTALAVGCTDEFTEQQLDELQVSSAYVSISPAGGSNSIVVTSNAAWEFVDDKGVNAVPSWLTVSPMSGSAGSVTVQFTGEASESYRVANLKITVGDKEQYVNVAQGVDAASESTIAEALTGGDGRKLVITGAVTGYYQNAEKYGNIYITDDTGTILLYGIADRDGKFQNNPLSSWGIEMGDKLTVVGPRGSYQGTPQMNNVTVVKLEKSLIKIVGVDDEIIPKEGGERQVRVVCKGGGPTITIPEADKEWISVSDISMIPGVPDPQFPTIAVPDTAVVTIKALPNDKGGRSSTIVFGSASGESSSTVTATLSQGGAIVEISCADFNALEDGEALFKVSGIVTSIVMDKNDPTKPNKYGNFYIKDATGSIYVYGLLPEAGGATAQDVISSKGIKVGDIITVIGPKGSYKGSPQMINAYYVEHTPVETLTIAEFRAKPDNKNTYYLIKGIVEKVTEEGASDNMDVYGNFNLTDETGSVYVYGVSTGYNGETKKFGTLGVGYGDELTILAYKTTYSKYNLVEAVGMYVDHKKAE